MGTKQLLLIVLGVIIVILAIVVGLNIFAAQTVQRNEDAVILDLQHLASTAQSYYKREDETGGGGKSFVGFTISKSLQQTENGKYEILYVQAGRVLIQGTGIEESDNDNENGEVESGENNDRLKIAYQILVRPMRTSLRKIR